MFTRGWYGQYPGAWRPGAWGRGYAAGAWTAAAWGALTGWWGWGGSEPASHDYGDNIYYEGDEVYVDGQAAATGEQYYDAVQYQAQEETTTQENEEWMPLGVFALAAEGEEKAERVMQLAVNREGVIRGNYYDQTQESGYLIEGKVDKDTQRAAWHTAVSPDVIFETGVYNLTKDEAPVLVHYSANRNEQRTLVRLKQDEAPAPKAE